ncbi:SEL1-like repeat protein [Candidatus Odyssella thessalonicensis]|uniref:SEL1-like repeat protein n=1 Tax=Candidatus Odyssella thessalonicensis TaxID=84647 RepID=UPI000225C056|nr:SEL1-like repeat protein [Candidatus Odyssella thessalonicensis]
MLYQGLGVKEDARQSFSWAYKAAKQGDIDMAFSLYSSLQDNTPAQRFNLTEGEEADYKPE